MAAPGPGEPTIVVPLVGSAEVPAPVSVRPLSAAWLRIRSPAKLPGAILIVSASPVARPLVTASWIVLHAVARLRQSPLAATSSSTKNVLPAAGAAANANAATATATAPGRAPLIGQPYSAFGAGCERFTGRTCRLGRSIRRRR